MSTNFKPAANLSVTRYVGPAVEQGSRQRIQLTQGLNYVTLSKDDALELAIALIEVVNDTREHE